TGTLDAHDQSHLTQSTQSAIATGERQEWNNPDTGTSVAIDVKSTTTLHHRIDVSILKGTVQPVPPLDLVGEEYRAKKQVNVRSGPGVQYAVVGTLKGGETTLVVGKVAGSGWCAVAADGVVSGYVSMQLLANAESRWDTDTSDAAASTKPSSAVVRTTVDAS